MSPRRPAPGDIELALTRAFEFEAQIERKERSLRRRTQDVAKALAAVMGPGGHHHRWRVGIHAFDVDGTTKLAASYLEQEGDERRYRYAVLSGGPTVVRAFQMAELDPGDSDEPGRTSPRPPTRSRTPAARRVQPTLRFLHQHDR